MGEEPAIAQGGVEQGLRQARGGDDERGLPAQIERPGRSEERRDAFGEYPQLLHPLPAAGLVNDGFWQPAAKHGSLSRQGLEGQPWEPATRTAGIRLARSVFPRFGRTRNREPGMRIAELGYRCRALCKVKAVTMRYALAQNVARGLAVRTGNG
jgi:hypothetical protein